MEELKDNKTAKGEHVSCRIYDKNILTKLRNFKQLGFNSQSDLLRDSVTTFFESKGKKKTLKDEKLEQEIIKLKLDNKLKLIRQLQVSPIEANNLIENPETFNLDHINSNKILQDDGRLRCFTCGKFFESGAFTFELPDKYRSHVEGEHDRKLTDDERKIMLELMAQ